jgi:DNA-binding transcriptional ArsR family regulator
VESKGRGEKPRADRQGKLDQSLKALGHETRLQILGVLGYRETITPAEFGRERNEETSKVAYHFRYLREMDWIEVVETRPAGGSLEHVYRRTAIPLVTDDDWLQLPNDIREVLASTTINHLYGRIGQALEAGTFTARVSHNTWDSLLLDKQGWAEMMDLLDSTFKEANEVAERATGRLADSEEDGLLATVALIGFESPRGTGRESA